MSQPHPPLSDSPWFWLYTFATFGLVLLVLIGPKFEERRSQQERQFQGRTRALQQKSGAEPTVELSEPGETLLTLRPLYVVLGLMVAIGWASLWWQRWRSTQALGKVATSAPSSSPESGP